MQYVDLKKRFSFILALPIIQVVTRSWVTDMLLIHQSQPFDPKQPMGNLKKRKKRDDSETEVSSVENQSDVLLTQPNDKLKTNLRNIRDELRIIQNGLEKLDQFQRMISNSEELLKTMLSLCLQSSNEIYQNGERSHMQEQFNALYSDFKAGYQPIEFVIRFDEEDEPEATFTLLSIEDVFKDPVYIPTIETKLDALTAANQIQQFLEYLVGRQIELNMYEREYKEEIDLHLIQLNEIRNKISLKYNINPSELVGELRSRLQSQQHDQDIRFSIPPETAISLLSK